MKESVEYLEQGSVLHGSATGVMGTRLDLLLCGLPRREGEALWERLYALAARLDGIFNRFSPESELSRFNAGLQPQASLSAELAEAISLADSYRERTFGLFDVHIRARSAEAGRGLDFGGFAKGFFVRKAQEILRAAGVGRAYLDFGGSTILGIGTHPYGDSWRVSLTNPYSGGTLSEVDIRDETLSTSGNTPRYFGHIVHPSTGEPVVGPRMSSALCADPLDAEVLSTAAMLSGRRQLSALRDAFPGARIRVYELTTKTDE